MAFGIRSERTRLWGLPVRRADRGACAGDGVALSPDGADASFHDVSADGTRIAYRLTQPGGEALWARGWAAGSERMLVEGGDAHAHAIPRWSRDGARLAVIRTLRGGTQPAFRERWTDVTETPQATAWIVEADGTMRGVAPPRGDMFLVGDWSRDGAWLLGTCGLHTGDLSLCLAPSPGSDQRPPRRLLGRPRLSRPAR